MALHSVRFSAETATTFILLTGEPMTKRPAPEVHVPNKGWFRQKRARDLQRGDIVVFVSDRPDILIVDVMKRDAGTITYQVADIREGRAAEKLREETFLKKRLVAYSLAAVGN
ncbi:MAG: hypothetical protein NUV49_04280 [Patescibacteria group bacterium]|nr:hypothetical protein [Patescibacteria group bacterium]